MILLPIGVLLVQFSLPIDRGDIPHPLPLLDTKIVDLIHVGDGVDGVDGVQRNLWDVLPVAHLLVFSRKQNNHPHRNPGQIRFVK